MSPKPNILLVVFDSLSADAFNSHINTLPTLLGLQSRAMNYTNAYTCCPESSPARASLFTGLDIAAHGVWTDGVALPKRESPLPKVFAQNGFRSWLVGRRHLAGVSNWTTEHAQPYEFHQFDWAHGPLHQSKQNAYLTWLQEIAPETYSTIFPRQADPDNTKTSSSQHQAISTLPDELSFNTWVGQQALSQPGDTPYFGIAGFVVGQSMGASEATVEALDLRALRQADTALAVILDTLPENTVVAVTAGRGSVEASATNRLQEAAIKVPLMLCLPGGEPQTMHEAVSTMDIAPTLYECADIRPPQRLQGVSLISAPPRG